MNDDKLIHAKQTSFYNLLNEKNGTKITYKVPTYQRSYTWEYEHCKTLFDDILNSYNNKKHYYIGNLIFYKRKSNSKDKIIVDGQQRLTSLFLLLYSLKVKYNVLADDIDKEFLFCNIKKNNNNNSALRLKQNYYDNNIFSSIINSKPIKLEKNSNVYKAYNYFNEFLEETLIDNPKEFYNHIKSLEVVEIELKRTTNSNVQTVFEKINSTGKTLSYTDLIRNKLLIDRDTKKANEYAKKWENLEEILKHDQKNYINSFFADFIHYKSKSNDKNIFRLFKILYEKQSNSSIFAELEKNALYYMILKVQCLKELDVTGKYVVVTDTNNAKIKNITKAKPLLILSDYLGDTNLYPLYFYLYDIYENNNYENINKTHELLLHMLIRYRISNISGGGGALTSFCNHYINHHKLNKTNTCDIPKDLFEYLKSYGNNNNNDEKIKIFASDSDFENALQHSLDLKQAKVLLLEEERLANPAFILPDIQKWQNEHFMPQDIKNTTQKGKKWIKDLGGITKFETVFTKYLNTIGNLGLLDQSLNNHRNYSNNSWDNKINMLYNNQNKIFICTKDILKYKKVFNETSLKNRNKERAKKLSSTILGPTSKYE